MITISLCGSSTRRDEQVVDGVERRLAAVGRDLGESRRAYSGQNGLSRSTIRDQSFAGAEDARVRAHAVARGGVAEQRGEVVGAERPRRQRRVQVRDPEAARVHVELDVHAAVAGALDQLDRAARLLDAVARDEVRDLSRASARSAVRIASSTDSNWPASRLRVCVA